MTDPRYNYPRHPLFGIAPVLNRGFQRVDYDPYERLLIAKIREGRYTTTDLFDTNSLYLPYSERQGHLPYLPAFRAESRYTMTPKEARAYREEMHALDAEERAQRAARRAELEAEKERVRQAAAALREARERERQAREDAWRKEDERIRGAWAADAREREARQRGADFRYEQSAILRSRWECNTCFKPAKISTHPTRGYAMRCEPCDKTGYADHETLVQIIQNAAKPKDDFLAGSALAALSGPKQPA